MKKTNMKLYMELLKMTRASLEMLVHDFLNVRDIRFDNLNVTTVVDEDWVTIDELTLYYDEDLIIIGRPDGCSVPFQYGLIEIPNGGLIDIILTLESRLK